MSKKHALSVDTLGSSTNTAMSAAHSPAVYSGAVSENDEGTDTDYTESDVFNATNLSVSRSDSHTQTETNNDTSRHTPAEPSNHSVSQVHSNHPHDANAAFVAPSDSTTLPLQQTSTPAPTTHSPHESSDEESDDDDGDSVLAEHSLSRDRDYLRLKDHPHLLRLFESSSKVTSQIAAARAAIADAQGVASPTMSPHSPSPSCEPLPLNPSSSSSSLTGKSFALLTSPEGKVQAEHLLYSSTACAVHIPIPDTDAKASKQKKKSKGIFARKDASPMTEVGLRAQDGK